MRIQLAKLAKQRLGNAKGVAASSGKILSSMPPPKKVEENLLRQVRFHNFRHFVHRCYSYTNFVLS